MKDECIKKFGRAKFEYYIEHQHFTIALRDTLQSLIALNKNYTSHIMTRSLTCIELGIGECQELSTAVLVKLVEASRFDSHAVTLSGKKKPEEDMPYMHVIVLLGEMNPNSRLSDISSLRSQPKNMVVIDPLLGYVGSVKNYYADNKEYIDLYALHSFLNQCVSMRQQDIPGLNSIKQQVTELTDMVKRAQISKFKRMFFPEVNSSTGLILPTQPVPIFHQTHHEAKHARIQQLFDNQHPYEFYHADAINRFFAEPLRTDIQATMTDDACLQDQNNKLFS